MGKLSPEQARQLAELEKIRDSDDDEDDDDAIWVRNKNGHSTRLTGERARRWLKNNGYDLDDADDATRAEPLEAKEPSGKKPGGKKPGAVAEEPAEEPAEQDPPSAAAGRPNRRFF